MIDSPTLDQSIHCYDLQTKFLFVEFNSSKFQMLNHIYHLTIFNDENEILVQENVYASSIYPLEEQRKRKYRIELLVSTMQSEYLGKIGKDCEEFYPNYSPISCSMKLPHQLIIHRHHRRIESLDSKMIFYRVNESLVRKINLSKIHYVRKEN